MGHAFCKSKYCAKLLQLNIVEPIAFSNPIALKIRPHFGKEPKY